jgi:hypothetical protein
MPFQGQKSSNTGCKDMQRYAKICKDMQRYAKAKRIITESQRASAAHEVDLIIADQMLESFKAKISISQLALGICFTLMGHEVYAVHDVI